MPTPRAILWRPSPAPSPAEGTPEYAVFVTQGALRETTRHVWTAPEQEVLGFLFGERFESPDTGARYVVVSATSQSSYVVAEDAEEQIPVDAVHAAFLEARRRRLTLLGWYHSVPYTGDAGPDARDLRTHRANFRHPYQLGLVVAPRADRPVGGFFGLPAEGDGRGFLPFHELVDDLSILPDGTKRTVVPWQNYATDDPIVRTTTLAVSRPKIGTGPMSVLIPGGHAPARGGILRRRTTGRDRPGHRREINWVPILAAAGGLVVGLALAFAAFKFLK